MNKLTFISLFFLTSILWYSLSIYEFEGELLSTASCCKQWSAEKTSSCCSKMTETSETKTCNGNCKDNSCQCVSLTFFSNAFILKDRLVLEKIIELTESRTFTVHQEYVASYDYSFIWAPPKINNHSFS